MFLTLDKAFFFRGGQECSCKRFGNGKDVGKKGCLIQLLYELSTIPCFLVQYYFESFQ